MTQPWHTLTPQQQAQAWQQHNARQYPPPPMPVPVYMAGPQQAITRDRRSTSHGLHLFLTIITFGMWGLFVWLPITIWHKAGPKRKAVTRFQ